MGKKRKFTDNNENEPNKRCQKCREKVEYFDIYCHKCGHPTNLLKEELSAKENFKEVWMNFNNEYKKYIPLSALVWFISILPMIVIFVYLFFNPISSNDNINLLINSAVVLVFLPLALLPFSFVGKSEPTVSNYFNHFKKYPSVLCFSFVTVVFYAGIELICKRLNADPILNIVWLILTIYWIAINVPTLGLIFNKEMIPAKAVWLAYKAGKETRWQQLFTAWRIFILLPGFVFTLPLLYLLPLSYYKRLDDLDLFTNIQ